MSRQNFLYPACFPSSLFVDVSRLCARKMPKGSLSPQQGIQLPRQNSIPVISGKRLLHLPIWEIRRGPRCFL
jgi:hypothetical protein